MEHIQPSGLLNSGISFVGKISLCFSSIRVSLLPLLLLFPSSPLLLLLSRFPPCVRFILFFLRISFLSSSLVAPLVVSLLFSAPTSSSFCHPVFLSSSSSSLLFSFFCREDSETSDPVPSCPGSPGLFSLIVLFLSYSCGHVPHAFSTSSHPLSAYFCLFSMG